MVKEIDGYNINYKVSGPGGNRKVAIVLQGWGTDLTMYDPVASYINDKYRVVQLDLPGFGGSDEPREAWSVDDFCDFFCRFAVDIEIKKATLIGHSYGGRMIIKMAARAYDGKLPFEIDKVVLIDSAGVMHKRSALQKFKVKRYKTFKKFLTSRPVHAMFPEVIDYWISKQGSDDYRKASPVMKACLVKAVNEDLQDIMPKLSQETLLIWGTEDTVTPIDDAHIMEEKMPNAALVSIEGAGHFPLLDRPELFRDIIRSYLGVEKGGEKS